jgi:hypothetical protein
MRYFQHALPQPEPNEEDAPFWRHVQQGRLHFQCCEDCSAFTHPPTLHCARCGSPRRGWQPAPRHGSVYSFTVAHRASHPALRDDLPYNVVLLAFEGCDGVRLVSNAVDVAPEALRIGMRLEVFIEGEGAAAVPRARAATEPGAT